MQRRKVDLVRRLDDRPVAAVDFDIRIAGVDHPRRNLLAAVHDLDAGDLPATPASVVVFERDHRVLHGDEVALPEISRGAVPGLPEVVGRMQLDEARSPIAQQTHRYQTHLALKLLFDLGDHRCARADARRGFGGLLLRRRRSDGAGRQNGVPPLRRSELRAHFGAQFVDFVVIGRWFGRVGAGVNDAQRERPHRGGDD